MDIKDINRDKHIRSNRFESKLKNQIKHDILINDGDKYQKQIRKRIQSAQEQGRRNLSNNSVGKVFHGNSKKCDCMGNTRVVNRVNQRMARKQINFDQ